MDGCNFRPIRVLNQDYIYQKNVLINGKWVKIRAIDLFLLLKTIKASMKITKAKKRLGIILLLLAIIIIIAYFPPPPQDSIQYYERESGQLKTEKVAGEKWLVWLYNNPIGEATLWALVKRKLVSSIYGKMMDRTSYHPAGPGRLSSFSFPGQWEFDSKQKD